MGVTCYLDATEAGRWFTIESWAANGPILTQRVQAGAALADDTWVTANDGSSFLAPAGSVTVAANVGSQMHFG